MIDSGTVEAFLGKRNSDSHFSWLKQSPANAPSAVSQESMMKQFWIVFFLPLVKALLFVLGKALIWESLLLCHVHHCVEEWSGFFCLCCVYIPYSSLLRGSEHMLVCESHSGWKEAALEAKLLPAVLTILIEVHQSIWGVGGKKWRDFQSAMFDLCYKSRTTLFQPHWRQKEGMWTPCHPRTCRSTGTSVNFGILPYNILAEQDAVALWGAAAINHTGNFSSC